MIEIYDSNLSKKDIKNNKESIACRGIIKDNKRILVVHLAKTDIYNLPGGRCNEKESFKDCVAREVEEETGYIVTPIKQTITVKEHFESLTFITHYFTCELATQKGTVALTKEEKALDLTSFWMPVDALIHELSTNLTKHAFGPNIHQREFLGLMHSL